MQVVMYMGMSLSGQVARPDGDVDFLSDESWNHYSEILKDFGATVIGRRTYEAIVEDGDDELEGVTTMVLSSQLEPTGDIQVVRSTKEAIALGQDLGLDRLLLGGGTKTNASFLNDRLVDEVWIDVEAKLIPNGLPVVAELSSDVSMKVIDSQTVGDTIQLRYEIVSA